MIDLRRLLFLIASICLISSCGSGGASSTGQQPVTTTPQTDPNYVRLTSDPGDYVGGGNEYAYSNANAIISVTNGSGLLTINIDGDLTWNGIFQLPDTYTQLAVGTYNNLTRYASHDDAVGGISFGGNGNDDGSGCDTLTGTLTIDKVSFDGTTLTAIDFRFVQYCNGVSAALRGEIHWDANDTTRPTGPLLTPPVGLWQPAIGVVPSSGNYFYLESEAGDSVGSGGTYLYTPDTSVIRINAVDRRLSVDAYGDEEWDAEFKVMISLDQLEVGYYGQLQRYPFHNEARGGIRVSGEGRNCSNLTGWFVVDSVTYDATSLEAFELRFEQICEGSTAALHGAIRWDVNDTTLPPGPVLPVPTGLWRPAPGITPATGSYIYLESEIGDWVGEGNSVVYTPADRQFTVRTSADKSLAVETDPYERWRGDFIAMDFLNRLEVGYYGNVQRYSYNNPALGGMSWIRVGRTCETVSGWFAVDSITFDGAAVTAVDLRFEQHCNDAEPALHGEVHWVQ